MKRYIQYIVIILLFCISLIYTEDITNLVRTKDPIMQKIIEVSENNRIESVNAIIEDDEIKPGVNGCEIDINRSYENMKRINEYKESMLKYRDIVPEITIDNIYNKYISSGNNKRNVSLVVYVLNNMDKVNNIDNIKLNIFLDSNLLINGRIDISNNKKIYNGGNNGIYDDTVIEWVNDVINSNYNKSIYCLNINKNDDNLVSCSRNRMYSITPKIIVRDMYNFKSNIYNGSIIYFDENSIDKIIPISSYLIKKGYNIVYLDELLSEKNC